jgi:hypothetical protein
MSLCDVRRFLVLLPSRRAARPAIVPRRAGVPPRRAHGTLLAKVSEWVAHFLERVRNAFRRNDYSYYEPYKIDTKNKRETPKSRHLIVYTFKKFYHKRREISMAKTNFTIVRNAAYRGGDFKTRQRHNERVYNYIKEQQQRLWDALDALLKAVARAQEVDYAQ